MSVTGLEVIDFEEESYGKTIGLQRGDIIIKVDNVYLDSVEKLNEIIRRNSGSHSGYTFIRNKTEYTLAGESRLLGLLLEPKVLGGIRPHPPVSESTYQSSSEIALQEVVVTDIRMPFWSMVIFMLKWALASIPAIMILWVTIYVLISVIG